MLTWGKVVASTSGNSEFKSFGRDARSSIFDMQERAPAFRHSILRISVDSDFVIPSDTKRPAPRLQQPSAEVAAPSNSHSAPPSSANTDA
jgi:hypothetical protein